MNGNDHARRLVGILAAALAAALFVIPLASAGQRHSQRDQDGWYYTALRGGAANSAAAGITACQTNRTFDQAVKAQALPSIVAALEGSTSNTQAASC